MNPRLSCIVSTFNRPLELQLMLLSLRLQTEPNIEIVIADNSTEESVIERNQAAAKLDSRIEYCLVQAPTCYVAASRLISSVTGDYLCFPSDDGYYMPGFAKLMVEHAEQNQLGLVYCDMVDDPRMFGRYCVRDVRPSLGYIDKTCYIVKREEFHGFPQREGDNDWAADWWLVDDLIKRGVRHGKLNQLLVVHN